MYKIIDGKQISSDIKLEIAGEVKKIKEQGAKTPHLAAPNLQSPLMALSA